jgi:hypothetical protein
MQASAVFRSTSATSSQRFTASHRARGSTRFMDNPFGEP